MDDTISRQAAIDALEEPCKVPESWTDEYAVGERMQWEKDVKALNSLPSAQTERPFEIQDILDYLDTALHPIISPEYWNVYSELHDMISTLPSAQPIDVQEAYYRGKIDGVKECTARLKKVNKEFANG